ncbi:MAG: hypothetical protein ACREDM_07100 [Methylocella sp.]
MTDLFSAYEVQAPGATIPAYLIESTAPNNIDDPATNLSVPPNTEAISADVAIGRIVDHLMAFANPTLVVNVHGFNNPRDIVLPGYWNTFEFVTKDDYIKNREIVVVGYRWPSEKIGIPDRTSFKAAPWFLIGLLIVGGLSSVVALFAYTLPQILRVTIGGFGAFALTISLTLLLLRIVVYFRDGYRATSFGVPDLVEVIRQIDKKLADKDDRRNHVELSFIAHSMGAYVVTSVVRILSDVFSPASVKPSVNMGVASADEPAESPDIIGHVFRLMRLVLVSPDIPAEALISNRANFLAASLHRFKEAFLFSNEGDEVLRQISTTANYFSFPTSSREYGYRLGNVGVLRSGDKSANGKYGIDKYAIPPGVDLKKLRIGYMTLNKLYDQLDNSGLGQLQRDLPNCFSYFDCTDCVDNGKGMLTLARPGKKNKLWPWKHLFLLLRYLWSRSPDVHGGYFKSQFLETLIYRLVCIGYAETEKAYAGKLNSECERHQVKALVKT